MSYAKENWQDFQWSFHRWKFKNKENFFKKAKTIARDMEEDFLWKANEIIIPHQKVRIFYSEEPVQYTEEKIQELINQRLKTNNKLKQDELLQNSSWLWEGDKNTIEEEIRNNYKVGDYEQKGITIDIILESEKSKGFEFAEFFFLLHNHMTRYMWYFEDYHFLEKINKITQKEIDNHYQYNEKFQSKINKKLPTFTFDLGS